MPAVEYHSTSSSRYKGARQVHQNKTRFNPSRHQPDRALPPNVTRQATSLCCRRCQLIIKWKLDYGKYPTLVNIRKALRSCGACGEKAVSIPFHHLCQDCSEELGVCAKCRLAPEESEARAMDAIRRGGALDEEDAEYYASLEEGGRGDDKDESDDDDDDDKSEEGGQGEQSDGNDQPKLTLKQRIAAALGHKDDADEDIPELLRLRGLDVSNLRHQLEEDKREDTLHAIKNQGKLRERDRRSALRKLAQGDERAAMEITKRAIMLAEGAGAGEEDEESDEGGDGEGAAESDDREGDDDEEVPVKKMTKDSKIDLNKMMSAPTADTNQISKAPLKLAKRNKTTNDAEDTPSDEETI